MKTGLYPGCSLKGSSREYRESLLALAETWGLSLEEVPDWNCCGATAAHNLNRDLALALPARILAAAESAGMTRLLVPCAACYNRLAATSHELLADPALRQRIGDCIENPFAASVEIVNIVQWLQTEVMPTMADKLRAPFNHRVACYYGCLLVRPPKLLQFDRAEEPQSLDEVMRRIGAEPIDWAYKTECCGAGFSMSRTDTVARLSGLILEDAQSRGAEALIVACPMCHSNLDMRQAAAEGRAKKKYGMPILYVTQALGLAAGIAPRRLGLQRHFVPVRLGGGGRGA